MKIIKEGQVPNPNFRGTCRYCSTEIEAEPGEVKHHSGDQREQTPDYYMATCPVCSHGINVVPLNAKSIRY